MTPLFPETGLIEGTDATGLSTLFVILAGVFGGLVREMIDQVGLKLPTVSDGTLNLGFFSALIIGGIAGFYFGDTLLSAFTSGLTSATLFGAIINKQNATI